MRVVRVGQHATADAQDHRAMPLHQDREGQLGGLAPVGREPLQELSVRQLPDRPEIEERAKLPEDSPVLADRHSLDPPPASPPPKDMSNGTTGVCGSRIRRILADPSVIATHARWLTSSPSGRTPRPHAAGLRAP